MSKLSTREQKRRADQSKTDKPETDKAVEVPEITIDTLATQTEQGLENARAIFFKQMGANELIQSLKKEGYRIVKDDEEPAEAA